MGNCYYFLSLFSSSNIYSHDFDPLWYTLGQKSIFCPKIHILKISVLTKFTFLKSHLSQNSQFQSLIFDKIHIFQASNSREFLDKKLIFAPLCARFTVSLVFKSRNGLDIYQKKTCIQSAGSNYRERCLSRPGQWLHISSIIW